MVPPEPSEKQKVMEDVIACERLRAKELEKNEINMTADELRTILKTERRRMAKIAADLAALRMAAVELQSQAEVIEENRINGLMRRLEDMQQEKGRIILELEREEELLTNTLQKQLSEVRREKALLQQQIDREKRLKSSLEGQFSTLKGVDQNEGMGEMIIELDEMEEEEDQQVELPDLAGISGDEKQQGELPDLARISADEKQNA